MHLLNLKTSFLKQAEVFCIGDVVGYPVNTFEFLRPLLKSLDYDLPKCTISVPFALSLGKIFQGFYTVLYPWLSKSWLPQPLVLPAEVYKVTVFFPTHIPAEIINQLV